MTGNGEAVARTLEDLAALAGVSRATVSRVINRGPVAESTRNHVLSVLERTNYRPNLAARSLATGKTGVVGVVIHEPASIVFRDAYFSALLQGITETLSEEAVGVMLWMTHGSKEETLEQVLSTRFIDGLICTATLLDDPLVDGLLVADIPAVLLGHRRHDASASYVDIDNVASAEDMVDHLIDIGRTRIGHITGARGTVSGEDRLTGYHHALDRAGIGERFVVNGDFNEPSGYTGALELFNDGVDAIFTGSDAMALGVYRAAAERGVRIPGDVAVGGYDDLPFASQLDPTLTTVRQNVPAQGAAAARSILKIIDRSPAAPTRVIMPTELVIRQSTAGGMTNSL